MKYEEEAEAVADSDGVVDSKGQVHPCIIVGIFCDANKEALCLASTISKEDTNSRMHIPQAWIKNRRRLSVENKQRKSKGKNLPAVGKGSDNRSLSS